MSIRNNKYQAKYLLPVRPKRKTPICVRMSNSAAEVVLRERTVAIKDLESRATFLQNQINTLRVENRTLRNVQGRQERELRKYKGVSDIPSLLQSHKDEIKALEANTSSLRKELRDCQKELKLKCSANLRKDQKIENKTFRDVQNRHEKELRKFKVGVGGVAQSHKDEIKALEANTSSLQRELRDCQKELKLKCGVILRKDQQIEKLNAVSKRNEKHLQEVNNENKELKIQKKKFEEESKKSLGVNELKLKNERLQKKIQQMSNKILKLEESLGSADHHNTQLKEDLAKLQKSYEGLQHINTSLKCYPLVHSIATQTASFCGASNSKIPTNSDLSNCRSSGDQFPGTVLGWMTNEGHLGEINNSKDDKIVWNNLRNNCSETTLVSLSSLQTEQ